MRTSRLAAPLAIAALAAAAWLAGPLRAPPPAATFSADAPAAAQAAAAAKAPAVELPNRDGTLKFGVLGDFGTGKREQYDLGAQMAKLHERFPFELIITV